MKIWVDDIRTAPPGYVWCKSVNHARETILQAEERQETIELIDLDHDAGDYVIDGGDYIKLLDWMAETGRKYPIRLHTANPVGRANMQRLIDRYLV
jgi:hypothetical protein